MDQVTSASTAASSMLRTTRRSRSGRSTCATASPEAPMSVRWARVIDGALLVGLGIGAAGCGGASARTPQSISDQLNQTDASLRSAIDGWRAGGDPPSVAPPQELLDQAEALEADSLYLAEHPSLTVRVMPLLPANLHAEMTRLVRAKRDLLRLSSGGKHRKFKVGAPAPLSALIAFYREATQRYGVAWNYLAAINLVETKFGRVKSNSVA